MEVGAVKQAFNNEVIQLKKNLNQAKIQVIHKLTRKAKTLTEKRTPQRLVEKNNKKAESAVKEVLLMKKLKPRDIARFIITFKGDLNSHLNKPTVDNDKACARLLLHKALQHKYKIIKDKFGDIPIKDLLMSRQERRKLKKEALDAKKNKKKGKQGNVVNSQGDWNVEDVKMGDPSKEIGQSDDDVDKQNDSDDNNPDISDDSKGIDLSDDDVDKQNDFDDNSQDISDDEDVPGTRQVVNDSDESSEGEAEMSDEHIDCESIGEKDESNDDEEEMGNDDSDNEIQNSDNDNGTKALGPGSLKILKPVTQAATKLSTPKPSSDDIDKFISKLKPKINPDKKVKDNKNKNLNEKMLKRKFKKDTSDSQIENKVIDPFFKTATGESYMSVAGPRQPDEFKEVHRQGNRQERRAAMFGRAPIRPRNDNQKFKQNTYQNRNGNEKFNSKFDGNDRSKFSDKNSYNDRNNKFNNRNSKFNDRNSKFYDNSNFNDRNSNFNDRKSKLERNLNNNVSEPKEEKLHPSWEAKKKQSGILPFTGKKIVFDES